MISSLLLGAAFAWAASGGVPVSPSGGRAPQSPPEGVVAVLPAGIAEDRAETLRGVLVQAGYVDPVLVPAEKFAAAVKVVQVRGLPSPDECPSRVPTEGWRRRLEDAKARFQLLAFTEALAELVALDVEVVCLASPPAAADLFRLELAMAEAHTFLAQASGRDAGKRSFHEGEARAALQRAASFGAALAAPPDLAPEVLAAFDKIRRQAAADDVARVVVAGPGARVGARFNGRPLEDGVMDAVGGTNLVEAASGAEVTGAARLKLSGRTLVWLVPEGARTLDQELADATRHLAAGELDEEGSMLLAAAARLLGDGAPVVFLADRGSALERLVPDGAGLRTEPLGALPAPPVDRWRFVAGVGGGGGWSSVSGGELDGLGGPNLGMTVYTRVALVDWVAIAAAVNPSAVTSSIPADQGGGTLVRATVPARLGVRFGPHTRRFAVEGGVDAGVHYFGHFDRERVSFLVLGAAGLTGAVGPHLGLRAETWAGAGLGYAALGGTLALEGRL